MDSFYLTLSSDSSKQFFGNNTISHFSTHLMRPICPTGKFYQAAVCEVFHPPCESKSPIFLYSDVVKPVLVSDTAARLLRVLPPHKPIANHHIFPHLYYIPVEKQNFSTVTISFHTKTGERYPFQGGAYPATVVLHFREVSSNNP